MRTIDMLKRQCFVDEVSSEEGCPIAEAEIKVAKPLPETQGLFESP